jgi:hypothetical protein
MLASRPPAELAFLAAALAAWSVVAALAVFGSRRRAGGRAVALVRVLLPAWRFFERPGEEFRLELRLEPSGGSEPDKWRPAFGESLHPGPAALFINARGNAELAERGLVEQACEELQEWEGEGASASAAYALLLALARRKLAERGTLAADARFRFRITRRPAGTPPARATVALESAVHAAGAPRAGEP